jgi:uncharacterized protein YycO
MHRGEIFLYSGKGFIAGLIKEVTHSQFSHAGWILEDHSIIEADVMGVEKEPFPYPLDRVVIIKIILHPEVLDTVLKVAEEQVGKPYDYKLFLGMGLRWLRGKLSGYDWMESRRRKVPGWPKGYICSELIAKPLLFHAGIAFNQEIHPDNTVPEDIWQWAQKNPDRCKITHVGRRIQYSRVT